MLSYVDSSHIIRNRLQITAELIRLKISEFVFYPNFNYLNFNRILAEFYPVLSEF